MRHTPERHRDATDRTVKDIRRRTRKRYSSEDKITPADVYFDRGEIILLERERIKRDIIKQRRLQYRNQAA